MLKYLFSLGLLIIVFVEFAQAPSNDATERWDGSYGSLGTKCPDGAYTWKIDYKPRETDKKVVLTGHINLIR